MVVFGLDFSKKERVQGESLLALLGEGLRDMLPKRMQSKLIVGEEFVSVQLEDANVCVEKHTAGLTQTLGTFDYVAGAVDQDLVRVIKSNLNSDTELHLLLSPDDALSKTVHLPKVATKNLKQTIGYEMNKHTPFNATQVYYDVVQYGETDTQALAQLTLIKKERLDDIVRDFGARNIKFNRALTAPERHLSEDAQRKLRLLNLLPIDKRRKSGLGFSRLWLYGVMILALLALSVLAPLLIKRNTAIRLEKEMFSLAQQASGEHDLWIQQADKLDVIESFTADLPVPLSVILEDISRRLDDGTYLTQAQYQTGQLTIRGTSKNASNLTEVLKKSPFISDAVFQASIVTMKDGMQGFYIVATLVKLNEVQ